MEDGLYTMSDEEYFALPYPSNSKLLKLRDSPKHLKHDLDNPTITTPAMRFGQAFHCAILLPDIYKETWGFLPDIDGRTTEGKKVKAEVMAKYGKNVLSLDEHLTIEEMKITLEEHPKAKALLASLIPTKKEQVIIWTHQPTGLKCKAKIDGISEHNLAIDIKTTNDASLKEFMRSLHTYGYHRQASYYLQGLNALGIMAKSFIFIAIEKEPPYGIGLYNIDHESLAIGHAENLNALYLWKECEEKQQWLDYNEGKIVDISLPNWAKN